MNKRTRDLVKQIWVLNLMLRLLSVLMLVVLLLLLMIITVWVFRMLMEMVSMIDTKRRGQW